MAWGERLQTTNHLYTLIINHQNDMGSKTNKKNGFDLSEGNFSWLSLLCAWPDFGGILDAHLYARFFVIV